MMPVYVVALSLSAGMCFATCMIVFKWSNIWRDAGQGTMFMMFVCLCLWSALTLARTFVVFSGVDNWDSLELPDVLSVSIGTETLFNAVSMWFALSAYELYRRAVRPRLQHQSQRILKLYSGVVYSVALIFIATVVTMERLQIRFLARDGGNDLVASWILCYMTWGTWGIHLLSLLYGAVIAISLFCQRHQLQLAKLPMALLVIVGLFFLLNMPYLIVAPLSEYESTSDVTIVEWPIMLKLLRAMTYSSGAVISVIMGVSIRGFDAFYAPTASSQSKMSFRGPPSFFILADSTSHISC
ncbi:unnamed protein product [Aphanomyces euteiches]|uniref:Uncharacterized protein n=1 Tax=Aphanomyces euteiches TaxID=100861 RepID=A0A6G0X6P0_9STRA|nr:hypothetical protein Ae201684_007949 [Aphanomyces euteiches]KAH9074463.1 hypothetical protein Ae201684P_022270 [Aphanomyces euteiches]KAH9145421.1 hypothetical protein AeRB84_010681 [Aphanomyces euteiches]